MGALIRDTRQQRGKHEAKHRWFDEHGVVSVSSGLYVGDYMVMGDVSVDTKRDLEELCQCLDADHVRFRNEMVRARDAGVRLVILTENEDGVTDLESLALWVEPYDEFVRRNGSGKARRRYGKRFAQACRTMTERYGAEFQFCTPAEAGRRVCEILGIEVKEDGAV